MGLWSAMQECRRLRDEVESLHHRLRVQVGVWDMACDLLRAKDEETARLRSVAEDLETQILILEYDNRQLERRLADLSTEIRDGWERESDEESIRANG